MNSKRFIISFVSLLILATLFRLTIEPESLEYLDYEVLTFSGPGCTQENGRSHVFHTLARIATWNRANPAQVATCISSWFKPEGSVVELAIAGYASAQRENSVSLTIESTNASDQQKMYPPLRGAPEGWRVNRFHIDNSENPDARYRLRIVDNSANAGWIAVRNRINFYQLTTLSVIASMSETLRYILAVVFFAAVIFSSLFLIQCISQRPQPVFIYLFLFACAVFLHIRPEAFFHMDDWALLDRFQRIGVSAIFEAHNEHVIPLSLAILFSEITLFGQNYILYQIISASLLAANGLLLWNLAGKLFPQFSSNSRMILSLLYVLCGLHSEVVQWMICQTTLLSTFFILLCLQSTLVYQATNQSRHALLAALFGIAAPLSAAWGFVLVVLLPLIWRLNHSVPSEAALPEERVRQRIFFAILCALSLMVVAAFYFQFRSGVGHTLDSLELPSFSESLKFLFFASQISVVLRGIGVYPMPHSQLSTLQTNPVIAGCLGLSILLLLTLVFVQSKVTKKWSKLFLTLAILLAPLALVAVGRSTELSLTFRYTNLSLIGFFLLLLPALEKTPIRLRHLLVGAYIIAQVCLSLSYRRYHNFGGEMQRYLSRYSAWQDASAEEKMVRGNAPIVFGGDDRHIVGLLPILHPARKLDLLAKLPPADKPAP